MFEEHSIPFAEEDLKEAYDAIKQFLFLLVEVEIENLKNNTEGRTLHLEN